MAKVIVFHYSEIGKLPKLNEDELDGLRAKFNQVLSDYPQVNFNGTFVDEEGRGICDWEAPNAEVVNEVIEKVIGEKPVDGAVVVKQVL